MPSLIRVALVFDYHLGYARGVLRGIKDYAQSRPQVGLLPLDTDRVTRELFVAAQPTGLIASVPAAGLSKLLQRLRLPVVNVASVVPGLPFPRVVVNHR